MRERDNIITVIDDDLDAIAEYSHLGSIPEAKLMSQSRSKRFRSTGFENQGQPMSSTYTNNIDPSNTGTKFRVKSMRCSSNFEDPQMITFGSTKNIRLKMTKIDKSMKKLHSKRKNNWSKKDLKVKYLPNGANFQDVYNRTTHTLFDHMKTQQLNSEKSKIKYNGAITGSPYTEVDAMVNLRPKAFSSKSSIDLGKGKIIGGDLTTINAINNALNNDQKFSYISNRQVKYARTNTIGNDNGHKSSRGMPNNNPFKKDFGFYTQTKLRNHESKRPQTSAVNHSRDLYDPLTRSRGNKSHASKYSHQTSYMLTCKYSNHWRSSWEG